MKYAFFLNLVLSSLFFCCFSLVKLVLKLYEIGVFFSNEEVELKDYVFVIVRQTFVLGN